MKKWIEAYTQMFAEQNDNLRNDFNRIAMATFEKYYVYHCRETLLFAPVLFVLYGLNLVWMLGFEKSPHRMIAVIFIIIETLCTAGYVLGFTYLGRHKSGKIGAYRVIYVSHWSVWVFSVYSTFIIQKLSTESLFMMFLWTYVFMKNTLLQKKEILSILFGYLTVFFFIESLTDWLEKDRLLVAIGFAAFVIVGHMFQEERRFKDVALEYLKLCSFMDPLTTLYNRRGANAVCEAKMRQYGGKLGVIMLDIDFFKRYNDGFGHDKGDVCLKEVATQIKRVTEEDDRMIPIRHGGEEFVVLICAVTGDELFKIAEKIRTRVYDLKMETPCKEIDDVITVSVGATIVNSLPEHFGYEDVIGKADEALYQAKSKGRNRVVIL